MPTNKSKIATVLKQSAIPEIENVYLLGNNARRVTFHSQQRRAFNLIWALFQTGKLKKGDRVAIIGGGLAGLTAAIGANAKDCSVTLYEQGQEVLGLWSGNDTRYVHPNIYDWPKTVSEQELTKLPGLNWYADFAKSVGSQVREEWDAYKESIVVHNSTSVSQITQQGRTIKVSANPFMLNDFECVIVATGFGSEKSYGLVNSNTYWKNDSLHQAVSGKATINSFMVSGCGDGGLIDVLRLSLYQFDHREYSEGFLQHPSFQKVIVEILLIEKQLAKESEADFSALIVQRYQAITWPDDLIDLIRSKIRQDTSVHLNSGNISPLSKNASVHNRVLVYLLIRLRKISYTQGKAESFDPNSAGQHEVSIRKPNSSIEIIVVDHVIIRHGPQEVLSQLLGPNCTVPKIQDNDITSDQLWPDKFYKEMPKPTINQRKYLQENMVSLLKRIGDDDVSLGVGDVHGSPGYIVRVPDTKTVGYLENFKEHKGFPIKLTRISEIVAQYGFEALGYHSVPILKMGAPITNRMNQEYGKRNFGTLGCFAMNSYGQLGLISSYHALMSEDYKNSNEIVLLYDNNKSRFNKYLSIGNITETAPLRYNQDLTEEFFNLDAGFVLLAANISKINSYETVETSHKDDIRLDQIVKKIGAATGLTKGVVSAVACRVKVRFTGGTVVFNDVFEVRGTGSQFSGSGDSGALVINDKGQAMGIVFAGNNEVSYVCPIGPIINYFKCRIVVPQFQT